MQIASRTPTKRWLAVAVVAAVSLGAFAWVVVERNDDVVTRATERSSAPAEVADVTTTAFPSDGASTSRPAPTETVTVPTSVTGQPPPAVPSTATPGAPTGRQPTIRLASRADLASPSGLVDLPGDGPVLVSTLDGMVRSVDLTSGRSEVVLDLTDVVSTGGERGLLGIVASPDGSRLYANYTDRDGDTDIRSWPLRDGRPRGGAADGVLHLEIGQPFGNHNGGNLEFGPDGLLWIGTGDGGSSGDPGEVAQDASSLLGKMLRVRPEPGGGVTAPADNPDFGGRPEIWGIGLRNPWRYSFDPATGNLWIGDVGQATTEEVTVVERGADRPNFGWDDVEGDRPFEGRSQPSFVAPVVTYGHGPDGGCSVTGGRVYRGDDIPSLVGWYLFGDYCGGFIRAVRADDPTMTPIELDGDVGPIISFEMLEDGELVVLTPSGIQAVVPA